MTGCAHGQKPNEFRAKAWYIRQRDGMKKKVGLAFLWTCLLKPFLNLTWKYVFVYVIYCNTNDNMLKQGEDVAFSMHTFHIHESYLNYFYLMLAFPTLKPFWAFLFFLFSLERKYSITTFKVKAIVIMLLSCLIVLKSREAANAWKRIFQYILSADFRQ